jgi:hypothetical protein
MILDRASIITIIFVFSLFGRQTPRRSNSVARGNARGWTGASYEDPVFTSIPPCKVFDLALIHELKAEAR